MELTPPDITNSLLQAQKERQQAALAANPANSLVSDADKTKMKTKAKEFESFFVYQMMELMKPQVDSEFSGGTGEDMFRHTLNEHMAKSITDAGGFGITNTVYKQLLKQQEQRATTLANAAATYAKTPR